MSKQKIENLKRQAEKHYTVYFKLVDNYSCGLSLGEHISPEMIHHKTEFNRIMDELAEIDPTVPAFRL
jgi:hypothetical protein